MVVINARFLTQAVTGSQRFAIEISRRLRNRAPYMRFVAPRNILHRDVADELEVETLGSLTGHLWEQVELPRFLRRAGHPLLINLVNTAPILYHNTVATLLDLSFLRHPEWFSRRFQLYYRFLVPLVARRAKAIVTISEFSRQEISHLLDIPEKRIHVVYCAASRIFSPPRRPAKKEYILAVSSMDPRKNLARLVEAFKKLKLDGLKLLMVGSKGRAFGDTRIDAAVQDSPNIEFTGYVSDTKLVDLYQGARLFVYPSLYEGFGLPPLEAMACGTPVVVSNTTSLPEVCADAAYYVDPHDADDIARGIRFVLDNPSLQEEMIRKGLERVKRFGWERSALGLLEVIEKTQEKE